jgi:hypothetical protein
MNTRVITLALIPFVCAPRAFAQQVIRYEPGEKDLKFVCPTVPPVATLKPGDTLDRQPNGISI